MKKIFAIALALVMVLSMASAFAANCVTPNWDCAEDVCALGKGKVEVIPYVKGNGCGNGVTYTPNTCAGAVNTEYVYFAVKVTVDENPNPEWWDDATLTFSLKGLDNFMINTVPMTGNVPGNVVKTANKGELKAGEYYFVFDGTWKAVKAADFDADVAGSLFYAKVTDASKAKVCAALEAKNDFNGATVNGYTVAYKKDATNPEAILTFTKDGKTVFVCVNADDKIVKFSVTNGATTYEVRTYNNDGTKFFDDSAKKDVDWTCDELGKFLKGVMDSFKLAFGTCITHKAVVANFGYDDKIESCFSWSKDVVSVVDANCVVSIPKTGDVSVVAYAVMAVVAAAGAMLKK